MSLCDDWRAQSPIAIDLNEDREQAGPSFCLRFGNVANYQWLLTVRDDFGSRARD